MTNTFIAVVPSMDVMARGRVARRFPDPAVTFGAVRREAGNAAKRSRRVVLHLR